MDKETALQAWKQMRSEIDPDNWLFVGTINLEMVDRAIEALEAVIKADANHPETPDSCNAETVEAIPTAWIEAEIKKLRDMDNGFASLSAGQIEAMLNKWRKEQEG